MAYGGIHIGMLATESQRDDMVKVPIVQRRRLFADMTDPCVSFPHEGAVDILDPPVSFPLSACSLISPVLFRMLGLIPRSPLLPLLRMRSLVCRRGSDCLRGVLDIPLGAISLRFFWVLDSVLRLIGAVMVSVLGVAAFVVSALLVLVRSSVLRLILTLCLTARLASTSVGIAIVGPMSRVVVFKVSHLVIIP